MSDGKPEGTSDGLLLGDRDGTSLGLWLGSVEGVVEGTSEDSG